MMEDRDYIEYQKHKNSEYESLCKRCGACCGVKDGDPCEELVAEPDGVHYRCRVYETRLGPRKTVSGKEFTCVELRVILDKSWAGHPECAYVKALRGLPSGE